MPTALSRDRLEAARSFVDRKARPLDRALLRHRFGEQGPEPALAAPAAFQNLDGGFGHALEPYTTSPASTAIATSIGLRLLVRLGAAGDDAMVRGTLAWLEGAI